MKPSDPKIDAAVAECLSLCKTSRIPQRTVSRFIDLLRISGKWTDAEIVEVQGKVIAAMLRESAEKLPNS